MRVGLVGIEGHAGAQYARLLSEQGKLAWIADSTPEGRAKARAWYGHPMTLGADWDPDTVDALVIASSVGERSKDAMKAILAHKSVLVEHPVSHSSARAEEVSKAARQRKQIYLSYLPLYYSDAMTQVRAWLDEIGTIENVRMTWTGYEEDIPHGGVIWEYGPYLLSVVAMLSGVPPTDVKAEAGTWSDGDPTSASIRIGFGDWTLDCALSLNEPEPTHEIWIKGRLGEIVCRPGYGEACIWRADRRKETSVLPVGDTREIALDELFTAMAGKYRPANGPRVEQSIISLCKGFEELVSTPART